MNFTDEQKALIEADQNLPENKFIFCAALAGVGKSTTIVEKLMHLINKVDVNSLKEHQICFFSFSKVAAGELKRQLSEKLDYNKHKDQIYISTIHSWAYMILASHARAFGSRLETVRDDSFEKYLITVFVEEEDPALKSHIVNDLLEKFIYIKRYIVLDPEEYLGDPDSIDVWEKVREYKVENDTWTFDDLIYECYWLLVAHPEILNSYRANIEYLFCDECLPYNTPVLLADGTFKMIGEIVEKRLNVEVLSYNTESGEQEKCRIINWSKTPNKKKLYKIKIRQNKRNYYGKYSTNFVVCTYDHEVYANRKWIKTEDLKIGMICQIETSAYKSSIYKVAGKGKESLRACMFTKDKARLISRIGSKNKNFNIFQKRGGNGKGFTEPQKFLLEQLGSCWEGEYILSTRKQNRKLALEYKTPIHYKIDIANADKKIAIEVDGESHSSLIRKEQDIRKDKFLKSIGWTVYRFKNNEVYQKIDKIKQMFANVDCPIDGKIISIDETFIDEPFVYDITVERCHNFYANGILVHNCQDVANGDIKLLDLFIENNPRIKTVFVGDINQTLYGFRGADYKFLIEFLDKHNAKVFGLSETFRFGQSLCELSRKIVDRIPIPDKYKLSTTTHQPETIINYMFEDTEAYTMKIVGIVEQKIRSGIKPEDIYIIYRQNKLSIPFERELSKRCIPYVIRRGGGFLFRNEIKILVAATHILYNVTEVDLIHLVSNMKIGLDTKTVKNVFQALGTPKKKMGALEFIDEVIIKKIAKIGEYRKQGFLALKEKYVSIKKLFEENPLNLFEQLAEVIEIDKMKFMEDTLNKEGLSNRKERWEYIRMLDNMHNDSENKDVSDFLNYLQVQFSSGREDDTKSNNAGKVRLQTIHGSKGETHPYSFVILDKMFVFSKEEFDPEYIADLYTTYVCLTRAKKEIYIACSEVYRFSWLFDLGEDGDKIENCSEAPDSKSSIDYLFQDSDFISNYESGKTKKRLVHNGVVKMTDKAVLFKIPDCSNMWLPKSHIGFNTDTKEIFISRWIAEQKGL